jgi:hypothetical protein
MVVDSYKCLDTYKELIILQPREGEASAGQNRTTLTILLFV